MATTSTRIITLGFSDTTNNNDSTTQFAAASNGASPEFNAFVTLASGANTFTKPAGGSTPVAVTIIPPVGNVVLITLKGVTGDTGIPLHPTDPTTIAVDPATFASFVLTAASQVLGVRLIWS